MGKCGLYLVTDENLDDNALQHIVSQAVAGGVSIVQLREKETDIRRFIKRAAMLKQILSGTDVPLIINDRVDVALAVDADGVHLGQSDMPAEMARKLLGDNKILGLSVESQQEFIDAQKMPVDYLGLSAIFATPTKANIKKEWGVEGLQQASASTIKPIVAIGGINATNIKQISQAGACGIALVSAICNANDPKLATQQLLEML